jgi:putative tricarboxylic transport membrane protein
MVIFLPLIQSLFKKARAKKAITTDAPSRKNEKESV